MFLIYNCFDGIVGNPKGYRTMRGAKAQADSVRTKVGKELRFAHDVNIEAQEKRGLIGYQIDRTLCTIK
jgi:hypothetical protein